MTVGPDIVIANKYNGAEAYLQRLDGSWQGPIDVMPELKGGPRRLRWPIWTGTAISMWSSVAGCRREPNYEWLPFGLFVRWGNGKGEFGARPGTDLPSIGLEVIWGIAAADVNGDGRPDLVVSTGRCDGPDNRARRTRSRQGSSSAAVLSCAERPGVAQRRCGASLRGRPNREREWARYLFVRLVAGLGHDHSARFPIGCTDHRALLLVVSTQGRPAPATPVASVFASGRMRPA